MEDIYLPYVRRFEKRVERDYIFPEDKLGVGDKMLYNQIIRNQAKIFFTNNRKHQLHYALILAINQNMKKFGFKPREV